MMSKTNEHLDEEAIEYETERVAQMYRDRYKERIECFYHSGKLYRIEVDSRKGLARRGTHYVAEFTMIRALNKFKWFLDRGDSKDPADFDNIVSIHLVQNYQRIKCSDAEYDFDQWLPDLEYPRSKEDDE